MSTLDEIIKEKKRVSEALARVDAQRERVASHLNELEATERVLARYSKSAPSRRTSSAKPSSTARAGAPAQSRDRPRRVAAKPNTGRGTPPSLGDQILALANGRTRQEIAAACEGVRANHLAIAISRRKRAGRIEERDGKLYATQSAAETQTRCGLTSTQGSGGLAAKLCRALIRPLGTAAALALLQQFPSALSGAGSSVESFANLQAELTKTLEEYKLRQIETSQIVQQLPGLLGPVSGTRNRCRSPGLQILAAVALEHEAGARQMMAGLPGSGEASRMELACMHDRSCQG
jgi:hypothetical protein